MPPPPLGGSDDGQKDKNFKPSQKVILRRMLRQLYLIQQEAENYIKRYKSKKQISQSQSPKVQKKNSRSTFEPIKQLKTTSTFKFNQTGTLANPTDERNNAGSGPNSQITKEEYMSAMSNTRQADDKSINFQKSRSHSRNRRGSFCSDYSHNQIGKVINKNELVGTIQLDRDMVSSKLNKRRNQT